MIRRILLPLAAILFPAGLMAVEMPKLKEVPSFVGRIQPAGDLPPIEQRIPAEPLIVDLEARGRVPGVNGGMVRMFISRARDVRYMAAYGYARLVGYIDDYTIAPDLLRDFEVLEHGKQIVLRLRRGHRWSDGAPFTTEDLRYWWEDVAQNRELSPAGPPVEILVDGRPPKVDVIDEVTISYTWDAPNPRFLVALAQARPMYIYRPAHFMKQYHKKYADPAELKKQMGDKHRTWAELHNRMDNLYKFDNPKLPVLQPWYNTSRKNGQRYVLKRNPFYHRIDRQGRQLPYVDTFELEVAAAGLIPLKTSNGEAGLQSRSLGFPDAPILKQNQKAHGFTTRLWRSGAASEVAIYPNLTYLDPVWRKLMRDVRFRRALSLGVSRKAVNKVLYYGLAEERAVAALEESPFFNPEYATAWARFDPEEANALLDEIGLTERNSAGIRLLPDGRPMEIVIETAGERREVADTLELVVATWAKLGVRLLVRPLDRDILRNRAYAGRSMMVAWYGWNNGVPTPDAVPLELAPVDQSNFAWPIWGQHYQTKGDMGQAPDLEAANRLLALFKKWTDAYTTEEKADAWREMLKIHAEQVFSIGTVSRAPVPVVANAKLMNVPDEALYAWDPGAQLGIHRIDEFFFEDGQGQ
ncbi:ABC transporter substrate-binding protein [Rhodobacteraceae bacterium NNCM2]|nr:ABC transporter substrate-binding protein [Coraliihabitans acroporae]